MIGLRDVSLPSPAFCIDVEIAEANARRMAEKALAAGLLLRPHVKTHKTVEGAALQTAHCEPGRAAIVVSTVAEARFFFAAGYRDILYGACAEPSKLPALWELHTTPGMALRVLVDSGDALDALDSVWRAAARALESSGGGAAAEGEAGAGAGAGGAAPPPWSVFVKIDTGYHRAGIDPASPDALALPARASRGPSTRLHGLYAHSGETYNTSAAEAAAIAARELSCVASLARALAGEGVPVPVVSVGSTPAASAHDYAGAAAEVPPRTRVELHPGNYIFHDRQQVASGSCGPSGVAPYVVARVIGRYPARGELLIDAGGLALHKDKGGLQDWGQLLGRPAYRLVRMSQEAAVVARADGSEVEWEEFPLGAAVRVVPNHACMAAAGHAALYAVKGGEVVGVWRPVKGWY